MRKETVEFIKFRIVSATRFLLERVMGEKSNVCVANVTISFKASKK